MNTLLDRGSIATDVATNLIEDAIKSGWAKVKQYFKDEDIKEDINLGIAYEKYLKQTKQKYGMIKTILYNKIPQSLLSFYVCAELKYNNDEINTELVTNVTDIGNKVIITGTGGLGKSTMLKYFFLNAIDYTELIPVMIELRSLNSQSGTDLSIKNAIYKALCDNGFNLEKQYFEYSLNEGGYLILLDGFDELNRENKAVIGESMKTFADKYHNNHFIVSSRPLEEFISWNDFTELQSQPLKKEQAISLISKLQFDENVKNKFIDALNLDLFNKYESFAQNPLLLTIMFMTYQNHASMPEKLNEFYEQAFLVLFNMHDATKDFFKRDIRTGLGVEDFKLIFSYICFKSYFADIFEFSDVTLNDYLTQAQKKFPQITFQISDFQEDLTQSVCMLIKDGLIYHFSHRSFQEYFAAIYTCKLTDDIQSKLLSARIKESPSVLSDDFFTMLFEFQSEKVNKIVLIPGIKKLQEYYNNFGFSMELLTKLFSGISFHKFANSDAYGTSLRIKDDYVCRICLLTKKLNNLQTTQTSVDDKDKEIIAKLKKDGNSTYSMSYEFEYLHNYLTDEEILYSVRWYKKDVDVLLQFLQKYDVSSISKRKVQSILDEL